MLYLIISFVIIFIDQLTKYFAVEYLKQSPPVVLIDNFLQFNYVENYGAAFGILQNKQFFFVIMTVIVIIGILFYVGMKKNLTTLTKVSLFIVIGGALGNFIDRIRLGYVIDFIDVKFWGFYDFPVFNLADSSIVVSAIIISILVLLDKYEY